MLIENDLYSHHRTTELTWTAQLLSLEKVHIQNNFASSVQFSSCDVNDALRRSRLRLCV